MRITGIFGSIYLISPIGANRAKRKASIICTQQGLNFQDVRSCAIKKQYSSGTGRGASVNGARVLVFQGLCG